MFALLLPSLPYLLNLPHFGACQYNDYYGIINLLRDGDGFTHDPVRWLTLKSNEHTVTLPALVYLANIRLTHGDNRGLSSFAIALLFTILLLLRQLVNSTLDPSPAAGWRVSLLLAAATFSPVPAHSVVMGFSGTIWFLSNAFAVAALHLVSRERDGRPGPIWPVLLVGGLGALSYSTNLSLWPALVVVALAVRRPRRDLVSIVVVGACAILFVSLRYTPLPYHPEPNLAHPLAVLEHTVVYLGGFLAGSVVPAAVLGSLGIVTSVVLWVILLRRSSDEARRMAPWLGLQLYALGNAVGTGVGRSGFGVHQALTSRYGSLAALFWVGWAVLLHLEARRRPDESRCHGWSPVMATVAIIGAVAASWVRGAPVLERYLENAHRQPLPAEALRLGIADLEALRFLSPVPEEVEHIRPFLRSLRHVPFDRPPVSWTFLPERVAVAGPPVHGFLDSARRVGTGAIRVTGWAWTPEEEITEVLVVGPEGQPLARMATGLPRPDVARKVNRAARRSGWAGYLPPDTGTWPLRAVARMASGTWRPVPGTASPPGSLHGEGSAEATQRSVDVAGAPPAASPATTEH